VRVDNAVVRVLDTLDETPLVPGLPEPTEHVGPRELIVVELRTDDGVDGLGLTYWHGALAPALRAAVEALARLAVGQDPMRVEQVAAVLRQAVGRTSAEGNGMFHLAMAAIDTACWDIRAKVAGQPLAALLGGCRDRIPGYASGALLRGFPVSVLEKSAEQLVQLGFRQLKMQCGHERTPGESADRVRAVRAAVGPEIELMLDVNQLWGTHEAIELGARLEPWRLSWIEDPTVPDPSALAKVAQALRTPVTAGEYAYGVAQFRQLMEAKALDIVMIDLLRVGGVTNWLKVAALAQAYNLPVVSHRLPEIDASLVSAVPNGLTIEYRPLTAGLFQEVPQFADGFVRVPAHPGLGLQLDPGAVRRYQVHEVTA
jgi:L-alanine-DL-glutamate epimerase-like enolase superfamily enzyme